METTNRPAPPPWNKDVPIKAIRMEASLLKAPSGDGRPIAKASKEPDSAKGKQPLKFSGESERIGEGDWAQKAPFGKHFRCL